MSSIAVTIIWKQGLHLRAAALLVQLAKRFHSTIWIRRGEYSAQATDIMAIMLLGAGLGSNLSIRATGLDEEHAVEAIAEFFATDESTIEQGTSGMCRSGEDMVLMNSKIHSLPSKRWN